MATTQKPATAVNIGPVVIGFASIWKPKAGLNSDKLKYSVKLYIPKKEKALIDEVKKAINAAVKEGVKANKWGGKDPAKIAGFKNPLRDGDKEDSDDALTKGHYFINASSVSKPGVIGRNKREIVDEDEVYSGAICYVSVNFYAFNEGGGKGIAAGLNNVLKWEDGERLNGRKSAQSEFADLLGDDDITDDDITDDDLELDFLF